MPRSARRWYIPELTVPEIGAAWTKALEIAESLDDAEYQLRSLLGLWFFHMRQRPASRRLELAQKFRALAAKRSDPNDRLIGERMIGVSQYYLGDHRVRGAISSTCSRTMSLLPNVAYHSLPESTSGWRRASSLRGSCGCRDFRIRRCAPPKAASRTLGRPITQFHCVTLCPGGMSDRAVGRRSGRGRTLRDDAARPFDKACADALARLRPQLSGSARHRAR